MKIYLLILLKITKVWILLIKLRGKSLLLCVNNGKQISKTYLEEYSALLEYMEKEKEKENKKKQEENFRYIREYSKIKWENSTNLEPHHKKKWTKYDCCFCGS